jgi:predicted cupin superfamily sugar epimerase
MTAEDVKKLLGLQAHPVEGGWYVRTYEAAEHIAAAGFSDRRYEAARRTGTAIYYLLEPDTFSEMHRLKSDEIFHFYMGDAVEMLHLLPDGSGRTMVLGTDLVMGERPQIVVERGVWQGSRLKDGGSWALMGCSVSPGFEFEDYEEGSRAELSAEWPEFAEHIARLTRG